MAQTMCLVLFGPDLIIANLSVTYFIDYNYIYYKTLVSIKNKKQEIKK